MSENKESKSSKKKYKFKPISSNEMREAILSDIQSLTEINGKLASALEIIKRSHSDVVISPIEQINSALEALKENDPKSNLRNIQKLMLRRLKTKAKELGSVK